MFRTYRSSTGTATMQNVVWGLGLLSLGIGVAELLAAKPAARRAGMRGGENVMRLYGLREIVTGLGLLANRDNPAPWLWARVAGDALDAATLAGGPLRRDPRHPVLRFALYAVAAIGVADLLAAGAVTRADRQQSARRLPSRHIDYSNRSGLPRAPHEMRGLAARQQQIASSSPAIH